MEKQKTFEDFCLIFLRVACFQGMKTLLTLACDLNVFIFRDFYLLAVFMRRRREITNISKVLSFYP